MALATTPVKVTMPASSQTLSNMMNTNVRSLEDAT